jgi:ribonuclease VapC
MTLDSSAVLAILFAEPGYLDLVDRILAADAVRIATPTVVEASVVFAGRRRSKDAGEVDALLKELGVTVVPFGERESHAAVAAFLRYGRGRHRAGLNLGDCFAYAAASVAGDSLLFVGDDFRTTDVEPA